MENWNRLNKEMLPLVEKKLGEIRNMPESDKYDAITEMLANMSLSPDEKLKLRRRLNAEFGYRPEDFNEAFGCRFSVMLWENFGRGS
jgi:hypothetical protein